MIHKISLLLIVQFFSFSIFSQKAYPVNWNFEVESNDGVYKLIMEATIEDGWFVYASTTPDGGPIASSFKFDNEESLGLKKGIEEKGDLIVKQSEMFDMEVHKYKKTVQFIKYFMPEDGIHTISGAVNFMTCNGMKCLPPKDVKFKISLNK